MLSRLVLQSARSGDLAPIQRRVAAFQAVNGNASDAYNFFDPLFKAAAESGQLDVLQYLIETIVVDFHTHLRLCSSLTIKAVKNVSARLELQESDVNRRFFRLGITPLMVAAANADLTCMLRLIHRKADVNAATSSFDLTALCFAAAADPDAVAMLLDHSSFSSPALNLATGFALVNATTESSLRSVSMLIEARADVNAMLGTFTMLLHVAYSPHVHMSDKTMRLLLDAGADNKEASDPYVPLRVAAMHGKVAVARVLIDAGSDMENPNTQTLITATSRLQREIVYLCIEKGADVNCKYVDDDGECFRPIKCSRFDLPIMKSLHDAGADPAGVLAFWASYCRRLHDTDAIAWLLDECGVDIDEYSTDYKGTAFAVAGFVHEVSKLRFLLNRGADIDSTMRNNANAVFMAAKDGDRDSVKFLTLRGADIRKQTFATPHSGSQSALSLAAEGRLSPLSPDVLLS
ncbi:MAG TPA: ankyrin repeat domain-containing protein, partial [Oculatellaceae cyanobacterium]